MRQGTLPVVVSESRGDTVEFFSQVFFGKELKFAPVSVHSLQIWRRFGGRVCTCRVKWRLDHENESVLSLPYKGFITTIVSERFK